jgi:hypothetical protein
MKRRRRCLPFRRILQFLNYPTEPSSSQAGNIHLENKQTRINSQNAISVLVPLKCNRLLNYSAFGTNLHACYAEIAIRELD